MRYYVMGWLPVVSVALAACSQQQVAKFCTTDQPLIGAVATVGAQGVAVAYPPGAPAAAVTGQVVQDVNGICAALPSAQPVAPPPAGAPVLVPKPK